MTRGAKLLILVLCLAVVGLAAWGFSILFKDTGTPMTKGDLLFSLAGKQTLSWSYGDRTISFSITDDAWVNREYPSYQIDRNAKKAITDEINEIHSRKVIEEPGDLAAFGLAQPRCTIVSDGITIAIGDEIPMGNQVYLSMGDGKVHLVNGTILTPFTRSLEEMVTLESVPDLSSATAIQVTTQEESFTLVKGSEGWYLDAEETSVNQNIATGLFAHIKALDWLSCADCTTPDLAEYGLDTPAAIYEITYEGGSYTVLLGDSTEEGVYAMVQGGAMVYRMDATAGNAMIAMNLKDLTQ